MLKIYPSKQCCNYVKYVIDLCDRDKQYTEYTRTVGVEGTLYRFLIQWLSQYRKIVVTLGVFIYMFIYYLFLFDLLKSWVRSVNSVLFFFLIDTPPTKTLNLIPFMLYYRWHIQDCMMTLSQTNKQTNKQ